ncbi:hypothetical protein AGMMS49957_06570 [Synergistales bacterium]|nr:hypothetical protein AGMMS49957_06570 [Synergistales bacterium]
MPKIENLKDLRAIKESAAKQMVSRQIGAPSVTVEPKDRKTASKQAE